MTAPAFSLRRLRYLIIPCLVTGITLFGPLPLSAQDGVAPDSAEPNEKAAKYHEALVRRPSGGYLFERFFNAWLDTGSVADLEAFLTRRAAENSGDIGESLLLAYFFSKQSDDEKAIGIFEKALAGDPDNAEAWFEKAKIEARLLNFEKAIADLGKASAAEPKDEIAIEIGKLQGRLLSRAGRGEEALATWKALAAEHADDEELLEDLVELHLAEGLIEEAVALMAGLIEKTGDAYLKITRQLRLGDIYQRSGKREEAIALYGTSLAASGRDTWLEKEILAQIEHVFRREDDIAGLNEHLVKLIGTESGRIALMKRRAIVLAELQEADEAAEVFAEILKLTPGDRENRETFIDLLGRLGKHAEAAEQMAALAALHPDDAEFIAQLAVRQDAAGQKEPAKASITTFLEKSDGSEYAHLRAARLLEQFKEDAAAGEVYGKLVAAFPQSLTAKESQAEFLHRTGRKDEAFAIWKSLAADGSGQDALRAARALASRGDRQGAYDILLARAEEFGTDLSFLSQICGEAVALEKFEEALPWAEKRLALAESPIDLNEAMRLVVAVLDRLERIPAHVELLKAKGNRTLPETCLLAELLERDGQYDAAEDVLLPELEAGSVLAITQQVRLFRSRDEWPGAAETQLRLVNLPAERTSSNVQELSQLYRRAAKYDEALKWVDEWKKLSPGATQPWVEQSSILMEADKPGEAIAVLRSAVQRFEDQTDLRSQLAGLHMQEGQFADAERLYWTLYEESEDISQKITWAGSLATVASNAGRLEALLEQFEERRRGNRTSIAPILAIAEIHRRDNNYEGRREALLEATRLRPEDLKLLHEIARIEEEEGNWEAASETLRSSLPLDKTGNTRERIALLELRYGDEEEGFRQLLELKDVNSMDADAILGLADAMIARSDMERAADFIATHRERFPDDYRLAYLEAIALVEDGRTAEAQSLFLDLLSWETEIAKPVATATTSARAVPAAVLEARKKAEAQVPKGTAELIGFRNEGYYALYYRQMLQQQRPRFQQYSGSSGGSRLVAQPTSLDNLKSFAKIHLIDLSQHMEDTEKDALAAQMSARGMASADIVLKIPTPAMNSGQISPIPIELLDAHPDRLDLLAVGVSIEQTLIYNAPEQINTELLARAYEKFLADYPEFAFSCAVAAACSGTEEGAALLRKALAEVPLEEEPSSVVTSVVAGAIRAKAPYTGDRESLLPDEFRLTLIEKSLAWREAALARAGEKDAAAVAQSFFAYETHSWTLRSLPDLTAFTDYLDMELARYEEIRRTDPAALSAGLISQYWPLRNLTQGRALLAKPDFPPLYLPDFPPNVLLHFAPIRNIGNAVATPEPDQILARVDHVKSPVLKVLLAHLAGDEARTEKEIESLLAAKATSGLSEMQIPLLASAFYGSVKEDPVRALALLEEIRTGSMSKEMRRLIDSSIVAYAAGAAEAADTPAASDPSPTIVAGREAALRLRYGVLNQNQRRELAAALTNLGLEQEAEQLRDKATASTNRSSNSPSPFLPATAQGLDDRVKKLVTDGKIEEATRLTLQNLRPTLKHMASGNAGGQVDYNLLQFIRTISRDTTLLPAIERELDPGDPAAATADALFEWGAFHEILGRLEKANGIYRAGLGIPGQRKRPGIEARVAALTCYTSPDEAGEYLSGFKKARFREVIDCLESVRRNMEYSNSGRDEQLPLILNMGRSVTAWLEAINETDLLTLDLSPLDYSVRNKIAEQNFGGSHEYLPGLYGDINPRSSWQLGRVQLAAGAELEKTRRQIHDDLCRSLMRSPQMARRAFSYYVGIRMGEDAEKTAADPEVEALARLALASAAKPFRAGTNQFGQHHRNFYSQGITLWSPEEYLMWLALRKGDGSDVAVMEAVRATKQRDVIVSAARFHDLAFCAPEEFPSKAMAYLRSGTAANQIQTGSHPSANEENFAIPAKLFAVWETRREKLGDLDLVAFWRDDLKQTPITAALLPVFLYEKTLREEGHEAARPILEAMTLSLLGEKEKWSGFRKDEKQGNEFSHPDHILYASLMQRLCNRIDTVMPVASYLRGEGLDAVGQITENTLVTGLASPRLVEDPAMTLSLFEKSPFFGSVESFHSLEMQRSNMLRDCLEEIKKNGAAKNRIRDFAGKKGTFGGDLVAAYLADNQKTAVAGVLGKYRKEVEVTLSGEKAGDLAAFVNRLYDGGGADYELLTEDARAVFDLLGTERAKTAREAIAEFLARKEFGDLNIRGDRDLERHLLTLLPPLWSARDWDLGVKVYWHAMELARRAMKAGSWNSYAYSGWTVEGDVLHDVMNSAPGSDLERIGMFERILASDKEGRIPITAGGMGFAGDLRSVFNQSGGEANPEAAMEATVAALHEVCGNDPSVLLSFYLMEMVFQLRPPFAPRLATWADSKAEGQPWSPIAKELAQGIRMAMQTSTNTAYKPLWPKVKEIESWQDHYITILKDDSRTLPWRVAVADEVCDANAALRPDTAMACTSILADALIADAPTNTWHAQRIAMQFNKVEKSAEWEALARRLHEGWIHKNRNNSKSSSSGLAFVPGTECVLAMLEMHLKLGDIEATRKVRTEKNAFDRIKGNARSLLVLVTYGDFEGAAHVLREGVEFQDIMDDYMVAANYYQMRYSQRAHEQLPLFLATIEDPALRYFAELTVLGAIDPLPELKEAGATYPVRGVRLVEAAKRFGEVDFASSPRSALIRERALQQIASMDPSSGVVGPIWEKEYSPEKCAAYCNLGNYKKIEHASRPLAAHAALRLRVADTSIVKDMIAAANESGASDYYRREALEHFSFRLIESLKHRGPQAKSEEWAAYTGALGLLLSDTKLEIFDHSNVVPLIGAYFTAASKSGQVGDFTVWAKALPDDRAEKIAAHIRRSPLPFWGSFVQILKTRVTDPNILPTPEVREEILTSLIAHPVTRRAYDLHDPFFRFAIDHNMLTVDEVRGDTGRRLEALFPRNGYSAGEIARYHADAGEWDTALEWADKSITQLAPEKLSGPYARIAMRRITILLEAKRDAEAAAALKELESKVDFQRLPADLQQTRASLLKLLKS